LDKLELALFGLGKASLLDSLVTLNPYLLPSFKCRDLIRAPFSSEGWIISIRAYSFKCREISFLKEKARHVIEIKLGFTAYVCSSLASSE
jgi:hypothetical protein